METHVLSELIDLLEQMGQVYGEATRKIRALEIALHSAAPEVEQAFLRELAQTQLARSDFAARIAAVRKSVALLEGSPD